MKSAEVMIDKHETAIKVLELICRCSKRILVLEDDLRGSVYTHFPDIVSKMRHEIEIKKKVIARLSQRYLKLFPTSL